MKKLIMSIFAISIGVILHSPVLAKQPRDIKIDCPTISSTLHFKDMGDLRGAKLCKTQEDEVAVSNTLVLLNGDVYTDLTEDLNDPNQPLTTNVKPDKTEDLPIGDEGKIFYWGPPWGATLAQPAIEYRAKLGLCDMDLIGSALENYQSYGGVFGFKADWQAAADYMVKKLASAAKEIEANIAKECGAKNVIDSPKTTKESSQKTVESLLDQVPTDDDLKPAPLPEEAKKSPLTGMVTELKGKIDMQLADRTWVSLKKGDLVPNDVTVAAGYNSEVTLQFSNRLILVIPPLSEINILTFQTAPETYYNHDLKLGTGELRAKVVEGDFKTNMRVTTPNSSASISGTDVGVSHDKEIGTSIWEIYDGTIEVRNTTTGEKKTISSSYGSLIKRLEVTKDGLMVEKTAMPKKQKGAKIPAWMYVGAAVLLVIGMAFFLKKRGRITSKPTRR